MKAIILVGGLGTRLRPITETVPKPMVEVAGRPFLEYKIEHLKKYGIRDIILCIGYLGDVVKSHFGDGSRFGVNIVYSTNNQLGTGGAIKNAESLIGDEDVFVTNGDTVVDFDLDKMIKMHLSDTKTPTMLITNAQNPKEQSIVLVENGIVTRFLNCKTPEHTAQLLENKKLIIHGGAYIIGKELISIIPKNQPCSIEKEIFPKFEGKIKAFYYDGYFKDLANETILNQFRAEMVSQK